jgi:hypothetical protein
MYMYLCTKARAVDMCVTHSTTKHKEKCSGRHSLFTLQGPGEMLLASGLHEKARHKTW